MTGNTLDPGLHFVTPFVNSVDQIDTRVKAIRVEGYTAASKEQQDLFLDATLNYHVDPRSAPRIVQDLGLNFEETIIRPRFLDIPKSVTDDYPTAIVLNSRDEIRTKATDLLRAQLEPRGIIVDGINFENFSYSDAYNAAIEEKQAAQQQVETERQRLAQQEIIAQQKVAAARGDAESQIERARGEAESNRLVGASLTAAILQNRYIEKLSDQISGDARAVRRRRPDPRPVEADADRDRIAGAVTEAVDVEALVVDALDRLPAPYRERLGSVAIVIEEEAAPEQLAAVGAAGLFGLYQGVPRTVYGAEGAQLPSKITIFRGPLLRAFRSPEALAAAVTRTVYHEIAHHFGISEARLEELASSAG